MSSVAEKRITPDEYLRLERAAETKSEYDDGVVYAMSGASERHNFIVAGLVRSLGNRLPSRFVVYPSDMRVRILRPTRFFYPDVTIVCGERRFADDERDVLLNPLVIFEVLSESTRGFAVGRNSSHIRRSSRCRSTSSSGRTSTSSSITGARAANGSTPPRAASTLRCRFPRQSASSRCARSTIRSISGRRKAISPPAPRSASRSAP